MSYLLINLNYVQRLSDGAFIPDDPANADYAEYLRWLADGNQALLADVPALAERIAAAMRKIDADADAIYGSVLGNRGEEYKGAEADAKAFKQAGYSGAVPTGVSSWVAASGMTAQGAADDILATADNWRGAMAQIRSNRLARKKAVEAAADQAGIDAAMAQWNGFATAMRAALGI
jgi:hypothetical protein